MNKNKNKDQSGAAVRGEAVAETDLTTIKCPSCNGHGLIGGHSGQTPESYEEHAEGCDDCDGQGKIIISKSDLAAFVSARAADALDSQPTFAEGWVLAKETVIEMPNGKKELGYTLMEGVGIFTSFDEVVKAIKELSLPLGWVGMTTLQLLPGWQIPEAAASSQPTDGGVRK